MPSPSLPVLPNSLGQKRLVTSPHPLSNFSASPLGLIGSLQIGGIVTGKHDCDALSYNFNITEAACLYLRMGGPGLRAIGSLPTHFLSVLQNSSKSKFGYHIPIRVLLPQQWRYAANSHTFWSLHRGFLHQGRTRVDSVLQR